MAVLTRKAAETLCMVFSPPEEHIFRKKYLGSRPFKNPHFVRFDHHQICIFTDLLKTVKSFFSAFIIKSTTLALLTWLKNLLYNRLKNKINSNKHRYYERFSPFSLLLWPSLFITSCSIPTCLSENPHIRITIPFHFS